VAGDGEQPVGALPARVLQRWAVCCAAAFDPRDPHAALARLGIALRASAEPLPLPGKRLFGAWDPVLRRIELFGCDGARTDEELVGSLGHELWHALAAARARVLHRAAAAAAASAARDETLARSFAERWLSCLGPRSARRCAAALRASADREQKPSAAIERCPAAVGVCP
jgi:hypothetical protein